MDNQKPEVSQETERNDATFVVPELVTPTSFTTQHAGDQKTAKGLKLLTTVCVVSSILQIALIEPLIGYILTGTFGEENSWGDSMGIVVLAYPLTVITLISFKAGSNLVKNRQKFGKDTLLLDKVFKIINSVSVIVIIGFLFILNLGNR